jgi:hypothetical protein
MTFADLGAIDRLAHRFSTAKPLLRFGETTISHSADPSRHPNDLALPTIERVDLGGAPAVRAADGLITRVVLIPFSQRLANDEPSPWSCPSRRIGGGSAQPGSAAKIHYHTPRRLPAVPTIENRGVRVFGRQRPPATAFALPVDEISLITRRSSTRRGAVWTTGGYYGSIAAHCTFLARTFATSSIWLFCSINHHGRPTSIGYRPTSRKGTQVCHIV